MEHKVIENLDDFQGWDDNDDLFNIEENQIEESDTKDEKKETDDVKDDVKDDTKDDVKDDKKKDDYFEEEVENNEDNHNDDDSDKNKQDEEDSESRLIYDYLKKKKFIESDEDVENMSDSDIEDLIEEKLDDAIEKGIEEIIKELPDVVKNIIKYTNDGGNPYDIINNISKLNVVDDDIDIDDENFQEAIIRQKMKSDGYDSDDIDALVENLKSSDKLKSKAEKYLNEIRSKKEEEQKKILRQQEEKKREQAKILKENKIEVNNLLNSNSSIGDIIIARKDKKELASYIYDKSIKLQNGNMITDFQKDLFYDVINNKQALMQLAILLRNRNEDGTFNFDSIKTNVETKVSKHIKDNLRRNDNNIPRETTNNKNKRFKSLTDYFD